MQKKNLKILIGMLCFFTIFQRANATCDYDRQVELMTYGYNVNAMYDPKTIVTDINGNEIEGMEESEIPDADAGQDSEYGIARVVDLEIRNIVDSIYVEVREEYLGEENFTIRDEDTDNGTYIYRVPDTENIRNYKITVYSADPNCTGDVLNSITVTTPKFNSLYYSPACNFLSNEYYCQEFVTTDINMSLEELGEIMAETMGTDASEETDNIENFWEKNKALIITILCAIGGIGVISLVIILVRKRRRKVL